MPDFVRSDLLRGDNAAFLLLALMLLTILLLLAWIGTAFRLRSLNRRIADLGRGLSGQNMEQVLVTHLEKVDRAEQRMDSMEQAVGILQAQLPACLQRVHMTRYDAFEDVGGEQSFSLALLNAQGDGVVITSVYSRMDARVYAKSILNGHASHALSKEEERAIREAAPR